MTDIPLESVYSGVVTLKGLRIIMFLAKLNGLDIWATDVGNAYLEAKTQEKVYIIAGPSSENWKDTCLLYSRLCTVFGQAAYIGMRDSPTRYETWVSAPPRKTAISGCARTGKCTNT
jgi:hypothetical protein